MADLFEQLERLIEGASDRRTGGTAWLEDASLSVYVRWAPYWTGGETTVPCAVVANVSVLQGERGNGRFTAFLDRFEGIADEHNRVVVIESVLEERFQSFFERRGYRRRREGSLDGPAPCYVRRLDGAASP